MYSSLPYIFLLTLVILITDFSSYRLAQLQDDIVHDFGFSIIPHYYNCFNDYIVISLLLVYLCLGKNHLLLLKSCIVLFILRLFFINLTVLPIITPECKERIPLPFTGRCRDLVFSGHTGLAILVLLFLVNEGTLNTLFASLVSILLVIVTLMGRHHYSLDIVLAIIASYIIFEHRDKF